VNKELRKDSCSYENTV